MTANEIVQNYKKNILGVKGPKCSISRHVTTLISKHGARIKVSDIDETVKALQAIRQTNAVQEAEYLRAQAELATQAAQTATQMAQAAAPVVA